MSLPRNFAVATVLRVYSIVVCALKFKFDNCVKWKLSIMSPHSIDFFSLVHLVQTWYCTVLP